jgi:putative oxidoreductase
MGAGGGVANMSFLERISPFFGRCAFVWFYLTSAMDIVGNWRGLVAEMTARHVPIPLLVLLIGLILIVMGSISLLFGYHTRHGAMLLFGMTIVAAVTMHGYWHYAAGAAHARELAIFARDIAICGGLLLLIGLGPGAFAVDNRSG